MRHQVKLLHFTETKGGFERVHVSGRATAGLGLGLGPGSWPPALTERFLSDFHIKSNFKSLLNKLKNY